MMVSMYASWMLCSTMSGSINPQDHVLTLLSTWKPQLLDRIAIKNGAYKFYLASYFVSVVGKVDGQGFIIYVALWH